MHILIATGACPPQGNGVERTMLSVAAAMRKLGARVTFLSPDVYYISELPSDLHWSDVGWITVTAFVFCVFATLYPAWRAARTDPASALRYE